MNSRGGSKLDFERERERALLERGKESIGGGGGGGGGDRLKSGRQEVKRQDSSGD